MWTQEGWANGEGDLMHSESIDKGVEKPLEHTDLLSFRHIKNKMETGEMVQSIKCFST